jgi:hypothetical protein
MRGAVLGLLLVFASCAQQPGSALIKNPEPAPPAIARAHAARASAPRVRMNDGTYLLTREALRGGQLVACGGATSVELNAALPYLQIRWVKRGLPMSKIDPAIQRGLDTVTSAEPLDCDYIRRISVSIRRDLGMPDAPASAVGSTSDAPAIPVPVTGNSPVKPNPEAILLKDAEMVSDLYLCGGSTPLELETMLSALYARGSEAGLSRIVTDLAISTGMEIANSAKSRDCPFIQSIAPDIRMLLNSRPPTVADRDLPRRATPPPPPIPVPAPTAGEQPWTPVPPETPATKRVDKEILVN